MRRSAPPAWTCVLTLSLMLGFVVGCGESVPPAPKREYADVTGTISLNGAPLKMGQVTFQPAAGAAVTGEIQADGTYSLKGVIGPNKVMIVSQDAQPPMSADNPASRQPPKSHIPVVFGTPASTLSFDVKAGKNTADFDVK